MTNLSCPTGVTVETVYAVEISYSPEAQGETPGGPARAPDARRAVAQRGDLVEAGGFLDFKSALLIFRAAQRSRKAIDICS